MAKPSFERLNKLRDKIEATSHAEVIRRALRLYEAMIDEVDKGNEVSIKSADGKETTFKPIFH